MMAIQAGALKDDAVKWNSINWTEARQQVRRLQVRIAKAVKDNRWNRVKALQHLLRDSGICSLLHAPRFLLLASRTVSVDNDAKFSREEVLIQRVINHDLTTFSMSNTIAGGASSPLL